MAKGSAKLCSVLVLLAIAAKFAASSDTDVLYQIGQFNNKLTYLQDRLDLFGNVTVHMKVTNAKLIALEDKLNALTTTVSSSVSSQLLQMNESNGKMNYLVDRMDSLESKFNALASTVTNFVGIFLKPLLSCVDAFARPLLNRGSGVYNIQLKGNSSPYEVYCMADPKGGLPWTVVQRRVDGSVDFYRNWTEYQRGFGDLENNFFIGLEKLHSLTTKGDPQELWVMLADEDGISAHAYYDRFAIGNAAEKYPLKVLGQYSGDAGNSLQYHKYMNFSTFDNDNDLTNTTNCAELFESGWWFDSCYQCDLNGIYGLLRWVHRRDITVPVKYAHMAIRPARK